VPLTCDMVQSGQGDIRENIIDLEHQFRRLKGDFALRVAHFKGESHALWNREQCVDDIWAHARKIETGFHWVQGDYHVRISTLQAVTARCKRQMQTSSASCYSGANNGESLSALRY
jgi:hypothetical protein